MISDHVYDWSEELGQDIDRRFAKKTREPSSAASVAHSASSRIAHRALQALWQVGLQVRQWARPRPQVLSVGKFSRDAACYGVRAVIRARRSFGASEKFSRGAADPRGGLFHQPGDLASKRKIRLKHHGDCCCYRYCRCCKPPGQHGRVLFRDGASSVLKKRRSTQRDGDR